MGLLRLFLAHLPVQHRPAPRLYPCARLLQELAPLPTPRSGHGMVIYRDRFFCMGGEGGIIERGVARDAKVFGQMESYDPRHQHLAKPRAQADAAPCRGGRHHRRLDLCGGRRRRPGRHGESAVHEAYLIMSWNTNGPPCPGRHDVLHFPSVNLYHFPTSNQELFFFHFISTTTPFLKR